MPGDPSSRECLKRSRDTSIQHSFICEEAPSLQRSSPLTPSFQELAYLPKKEVWQTQVLQSLAEKLLHVLEINVEDYHGDNEVILLLDVMTINEGRNYCAYRNGFLFEPRTSEDIEYLDRVMENQNLEEAWIGLKALKGLPRNSTDWNYFSNQEQMTNTVFEHLEEDDGRNIIGKICSFSQF